MNYLKKIKEKGLKISWVAEKMGIHRVALSKKLHGQRTITESDRKKLDNLLN